MDVALPGGLVSEGKLERNARFRELTGRVEQVLLESGSRDGWSAYVTALLACTLESIGGKPVDADRVAGLCMADRHFLMLRLAALLHGERMWLKVTCQACEALFDVEALRCDLPIKTAGPDYPFVNVDVGDMHLTVRVPCGADQALVEDLDEEEAMRLLLQRCVLSVDDAPPDAGFSRRLSEADIEAIDGALDAMSPAVCGELLVSCPECGCEQQAGLNHYLLGDLDKRFFYDEVHTLASHYHWSEADILDLPLERRRLYLDLISRAPLRSEGAQLS